MFNNDRIEKLESQIKDMKEYLKLVRILEFPTKELRWGAWGQEPIYVETTIYDLFKMILDHLNLEVSTTPATSQEIKLVKKTEIKTK